MRRRLIYVPIIHTASDMGSLAAELQSAYLRRHGEKLWREHNESIAAMWDEIERAVNGLELGFSRVKLYQDGLPVCGKEAEIVSDLAERGSRNHRILKRLMARGATLIGTEDPQLLLEDYRRVKEALAEPGMSGIPSEPPAQGDTSCRLLRERDQFIARRIEETLGGGETGVLFVGLLHRVEEHLAPEIEVVPLIPSLPLEQVPGRRRRGR